MDAGIVIDVNSFYPSIMMNLMPVEYINTGEESSITVLQEVLYVTRRNYK